MSEKKTYTLEQIKKAFWAHFHKSGEVFFDYRDIEELCTRSTNCEWLDMLQWLDPKEYQKEREKEPSNP
jgi:hypothetical protein